MIDDGGTDRLVGDTTSRLSGSWPPLGHALLTRPEATGFHGAPRVPGFDEDGREVLSLLAAAPGRAWYWRRWTAYRCARRLASASGVGAAGPRGT
ncbi:hypothetical protein ACFRAO_00585 [Streptomyces sp. NPDC056656]|uniref:hypothetical protein n=1 Tax=Streptomyces sp. NPDC056656 TaxID=3345895 RepID=UPI00368AD6FC